MSGWLWRVRSILEDQEWKVMVPMMVFCAMEWSSRLGLDQECVRYEYRVVVLSASAMVPLLEELL